MKIILAPDSFKESLSARDVALALQTGIKKASPDAQCIIMPMADGGEGTVDALVGANNGELITIEAHAPLRNKVSAKYGWLENSKTAIIEMAEASGLHLVNPAQRDPLFTSSYGTGELIADALDRGAKKLIIGLGGSATSDVGSGMLMALGVEIFDADGHLIPQGARALAKAATINISHMHPKLKEVEIIVASDVTNPLCGPDGAAYIFGPQKGATEQSVLEIDDNARHFANICQKQLGSQFINTPGAGAAGGLGFALLTFFGAQLRSGIEIVIEASGLAQAIKDCDLVITGEGKIDGQSVQGKTPFGVAKLAKQHNKPVIAVAGVLGSGYEALYQQGIDAMFSIVNGPSTLQDALNNAQINLETSAYNIMKNIALFKK